MGKLPLLPSSFLSSSLSEREPVEQSKSLTTTMSSSGDESNIEISKGSTSNQSSLISSCRKLVATDAPPPVHTVSLVGNLTSLSPRTDAAVATAVGSSSRSSLGRKSSRRKKGGGVAKSCRLLADHENAPDDIKRTAGKDSDAFQSGSRKHKLEATTTSSYRGVSYFLNRQDELGPDISSEGAMPVEDAELQWREAINAYSIVDVGEASKMDGEGTLDASDKVHSLSGGDDGRLQSIRNDVSLEKTHKIDSTEKSRVKFASLAGKTRDEQPEWDQVANSNDDEHAHNGSVYYDGK